jgi:hypothetical protein
MAHPHGRRILPAKGKGGTKRKIAPADVSPLIIAGRLALASIAGALNAGTEGTAAVLEARRRVVELLPDLDRGSDREQVAAKGFRKCLRRLMGKLPRGLSRQVALRKLGAGLNQGRRRSRRSPTKNGLKRLRCGARVADLLLESGDD